jgi:hypothetical protein
MNTDDGQRMNMQNNAMRKPMATKYPEKSPNYSPSTSYNYGQQNGYNPQAGYGAQTGNNGNYQRRRPERFKRDVPNTADRQLRQNDIIIRLLKEIRDRLPEPRNAPAAENEAAETAFESLPGAENWEGEEMAPPPVIDKEVSSGEDADAEHSCPGKNPI